MTPSHCIFKLIDNRLSCGVVAWPKESDYNLDYDKIEYQDSYIEACDLALENAIWFREEKDVERMKEAIWRQEMEKSNIILTSSFNRYATWEPEKMKPYKLLEGLEIEIGVLLEGVGMPSKGQQFAFLKQEKEESQDELWDKAITIWEAAQTNQEGINNLKSKFTIQRK